MESRMERKTIVNISESGSKHGLPKSREPSDEFFLTKYLKDHHVPAKDYETCDRSATQALFQKSVSIPRFRKNSLLRQIKEKTVARQIDTSEIKIKKLRKMLDIKKVAQVKRKVSNAKLVIKKDSTFDEEEILYDARTRLREHYEQIKRILHDRDNCLRDLYLVQPKPVALIEDKSSVPNTIVLKTMKIVVPDMNKSFDASGKRVFIEEMQMDTSLTNDLYDYTKAPLTERYYLDMARHRASWADRRVFAHRLSTGNPTDSPRQSLGYPSDGAGMPKFSVMSEDVRSIQGQMQRISPIIGRHFNIGRSVQMPLSLKKDGLADPTNHDFFPGVSEDMKGMSGVSRKTIQYMNTKNETKKDSQTQTKKNMDSYIWYLIDPAAKRKYDLFLQKSAAPIKTDSKDAYSSIKLRYATR